MRQGFRDVRKHAERIIMLVELMAKDSKLPCFALGDLTAANLRDRFQLGLSSAQCDEFVDRLVLSSAGSAFTRLYDMYQRLTEGVL
jgi:phosphatidylinositol 4-kinase